MPCIYWQEAIVIGIDAGLWGIAALVNIGYGIAWGNVLLGIGSVSQHIKLILTVVYITIHCNIIVNVYTTVDWENLMKFSDLLAKSNFYNIQIQSFDLIY